MIDQTYELLNYRFRDADVLREALTHSSCADSRLDSNERMEFLGDAVLGFIVVEHLWRTFPHLLEGELTKIKSVVVSRRSCAEASERLGLTTLLNMGKGMANRHTLPASIAAGVFESLVAAIYLDGGMEAARSFVLEHLGEAIHAAEASTHQHNFKSALQQHAQRHFSDNATYILLGHLGPDHAKQFQVCVELDGRRFPPAWAHSKKEAEQLAALAALEALQVAHPDGDGGFTLRDPAGDDAIRGPGEGI